MTLLRGPTPGDAASIFERYANDPQVTRYLSWSRHHSLEQTRAFLAFSDTEWEAWPAGPYLVELRDSGVLVGGTGLAFETPSRASTGYVFAPDTWGRGFATEALGAMSGLCERLGVGLLYALCHHEHRASQHVLEKCGFSLEAAVPEYADFPNLGVSAPQRVLRYAKGFQEPT